MESLFKDVFSKLIQLVVFLMMTGTLVSATIALQEKAFHAKQRGLVSLVSIHRQLMGHHGTRR